MGSQPRNTEFRSVFPQTDDFRVNCSLTPMNFERKFELFQNPYKLIYGIVMYNQSSIWGSEPGNKEFRSVYAPN
jgi:hypothetical protein